jgi:hypothetical protein
VLALLISERPEDADGPLHIEHLVVYGDLAKDATHRHLLTSVLDADLVRIAHVSNSVFEATTRMAQAASDTTTWTRWTFALNLRPAVAGDLNCITMFLAIYNSSITSVKPCCDAIELRLPWPHCLLSHLYIQNHDVFWALCFSVLASFGYFQTMQPDSHSAEPFGVTFELAWTLWCIRQRRHLSHRVTLRVRNSHWIRLCRRDWQF